MPFLLKACHVTYGRQYSLFDVFLAHYREYQIHIATYAYASEDYRESDVKKYYILILLIQHTVSHEPT